MFILNYSGGTQILKVCITQDQALELQNQGFNTICINEKAEITTNGNSLVYSFLTNPRESYQYEDVVQLNEKGIVQKVFDIRTCSHTLVTTNKCNSNCIMCPYSSDYRKTSEHVPVEFLMEQVRYLPNNTEHLVVTGGEPSLIGPSFFAIMRMIKDRFPNIVCLLLSNGRIFAVDSIIDEACSSFPQYTQIAIPIHGSSSNKHDSITSTPCSFDQTMIGLQKLLSKGFYIEIRIVVFKKNIDDMLSIAKLIAGKYPNVSVVNFMAAEMCGNAVLNKNDVWIDYDIAFEKCKNAIDILVSNGINVGIYNFPLCCVPQKYWGLYKKSISDYKIRYYEKCSNCCEKSSCGGVFSTSYKYAESSIRPYLNGE